MVKYILIFGSALVIASGTIPFLKRMAFRWGFMDLPTGRKIHSKPIPLLGGMAIYLGFMISLSLFDRYFILQLVSLLLGGTLVSFLGLWDDRRGLRPYFKLIGQILIIGITILSGIQVHFLHHPILNWIATFFWVLVITNAMNLLDNMDGLSGGVAAIASLFFFLLAVLNGQFLVAGLSAALFGACLGFLFYNLNPATIFMGDAGSLFIGFMLAMVGIKLRFPGKPDTVTWMIPVMVLGLPLFDTALVVFSRIRKGLNPLTTPGKDHVSHRLVILGMSRRKAVLILYLVCLGLGIMGGIVMNADVVKGYLLGGLLFLSALYVFWRLEKVSIN